MNELDKLSWLHNRIRQLIDDGTLSVKIHGECMMPWIENKSRVHMTPSRVYFPGDIVVVLSQQEQYLAHRVIGFYKKQGIIKILTQADSSPRPDTAVHLDAVLGKVSGGDCHPWAVSVPLHHRLKALFCFCKVIFRKVAKQ